MSSATTSVIIFGCVFGGAIIGMLVRKLLPAHHLSAESKDVVKLGTGLVGTMAALVLGLLVSAAKSSYDSEKNEVTDMSASVMLLDRILAHYGPEATEARDLLRRTVEGLISRIWTGDNPQPGPIAATQSTGEQLYDQLHLLKPTNDAQRELLSEARSVFTSIGRERLLLFQQRGSSLSVPLLIVLVSWFAIIFASFGLFAPGNGTVIMVLLVCALTVAGAMFLIMELDRPFSGLIQISSKPLQDALSRLGR